MDCGSLQFYDKIFMKKKNRLRHPELGLLKYHINIIYRY